MYLLQGDQYTLKMVKTLQQTVEDFADNRLLQKSFLWTGGLKKELSKIFWI